MQVSPFDRLKKYNSVEASLPRGFDTTYSKHDGGGSVDYDSDLVNITISYLPPDFELACYIVHKKLDIRLSIWDVIRFETGTSEFVWLAHSEKNLKEGMQYFSKILEDYGENYIHGVCEVFLKTHRHRKNQSEEWKYQERIELLNAEVDKYWKMKDYSAVVLALENLNIPLSKVLTSKLTYAKKKLKSLRHSNQ